MESNVCPVVFVAQYYRSLRSLKLTSPSTSILLLNADTYTTLLLATRDTHGSLMSESNVCPVVFVAQYYRSLRSLRLTSPSTSMLLLIADTYTRLRLAARYTHGSPMPILPM